MDDPYKTLGIKKNATSAEIKSAYRNLAKEHHPDLLMSKGVPEEIIAESKNKMRSINAAWDQIQKLKSTD